MLNDRVSVLQHCTCTLLDYKLLPADNVYYPCILQATNNLVVLARDEGGCQVIVAQDGLTKLKDVLFQEKDLDILQACVRVVACLTQGNRTRVRS